ncbi:DUF1398 family protein [Escherichia coli]|uniref:DUF1398 family protein n=1 Tax=Escherichia coli TaxID=562 RepID=UPI002874035A|nr:DUF1398 family protein [Escherichia coli]MDS0640854.1 DUF1398 family protein [Escherichia coli]
MSVGSTHHLEVVFVWKQNYILVDEYFFFCCTWIVNSAELKHHRIAHYIYYLATDNIRIITHDDTVLLLRGTRNLLKVSTTKNPAKIKEAALLHICGKSTFREYCSTLAGAGVFRWVTDVNHNKRSYYAIDNTLLYIEDVENNKPLI